MPILDRAALAASSRCGTSCGAPTRCRGDHGAGAARDAVMQRYTEAKARRAALDFDDLIAKTASLLAQPRARRVGALQARPRPRPHPGRRGQDTSPAQWQVVEALAAEFFSGAGARERSAHAVRRRRREAVDLLASRAPRPRCSPRMGERFARDRARRAGSSWRRIPLDLSFRTVEPVLAAVDHVFADPTRTPGLSARPSHRAPCRQAPGPRRPGRDLADRASGRHRADVDAWSPLDEETARAAGRAARRAHRRHHQRLARQRRDAGLGRAGRSRPATS